MFGLQEVSVPCAVPLTCIFVIKKDFKRKRRDFLSKLFATLGHGEVSISTYENSLG